MLTVRDIAALPELSLGVAAGADGLGNEVRWLHVSELSDPTPWLEGGELLLTTGLGLGEAARAQRDYVGRLAAHGLAGLAFGVGFDFADAPAALVAEADRVGFPVLTVPYEVPFIALTKEVATQLANDELERVTRALTVHERLAQTVLEGRGLPTLLAVLAESVDCSLALHDEAGRVVGERHGARRLSFDGALELPVVAGGEVATLRAAKTGGFTEADRLVLHHGQTALALELSRRRAVSAAELRLAGDLFDALEQTRLDDHELARRMAAFGLEPQRAYAALLAVGRAHDSPEATRLAVARELDGRGAAYLSAARRDRAAFLVAARDEDDALATARAVADAAPGVRVGVGRPAAGRALGRSLLEARAALDAGPGPVCSYRDLGSLELLLGLPTASLEAYVDRVLGGASASPRLIESLAALLDAGCRWSTAAERLGIHRHTLRYRMERLRRETGRHPDDPAERMELWLAVKARQALVARRPSAV